MNQWVYWDDLQEHAKFQGSYITKMYPTMGDNSEQLCPGGPSSTCRQQLSPQVLCPALRILGAVGLCEVHFLSLGRLKLLQSLKNRASFWRRQLYNSLFYKYNFFNPWVGLCFEVLSMTAFVESQSSYSDYYPPKAQNSPNIYGQTSWRKCFTIPNVMQTFLICITNDCLAVNRIWWWTMRLFRWL